MTRRSDAMAGGGAQPPLVVCSGITVSLGTGRARSTPLIGLDLSIDAGSSVAVCGPSGSGKSTLLRVLAGGQEPDEGTVEVGGLAPADARRAPGIGLIYQDFRLVLFLTALENVALAAEVRGHSRGDADDAARAVLVRLGIGHLADRYPAELSGGEQQRVAIARTLVSRPALVLADEPTAALDRATARAVVDQLATSVREFGTTLVVATHDRSVAESMDMTYELIDGGLHLALDSVA